MLCQQPNVAIIVLTLTSYYGHRFPHFIQEDDRIYLSDNDGQLVSVRWDGTDKKEHVKITGISTYGTYSPTPASEASVLF